MKKTLLTITLALIGFGYNANAQWQYTNGPTNGIVYSLASSGTSVFAGTFDVSNATGNTVFLYGTNWTSPGVLGVAIIYSLHINGTNIFAAGVSDVGAYLSADNGVTWTQKYNGIPVGFSGLPDTYALATCGTYVFVASNIGMYKTNDNANNWTAAGLVNKDVRSIAVSGSNIFAGTYGKGAYLSNDNGSTWNAINTGLTDTIVYSFAISGSNIFAGTNKGVYMSANNGSMWSAVNTGLPVGQVNAITVSGSAIFAGTANGVYLSTNNGVSWTAVNTGLTNTTILSLAINGTNLFVGTDGGGLWKRPLSELSTSVNDLTQNIVEVKISPNPFNSSATIKINNQENILGKTLSLKIFNSLGQLVQQVNNIKSETINLERGTLSNGLYYYELCSEQTKLQGGKFVIE